MRETLINVILNLLVEQATEPQDDEARARLDLARSALETGKACEERDAEAAKAKELRSAEKRRRAAEKLAAGGPPEEMGVGSDSDTDLPQMLPPTGRSRPKKSWDAAEADGEGGPSRDSRPRRACASRLAAHDDAGDDAARARSDSSDFEEDKKPARDKKPKKKRKYLTQDAIAAADDDDADAMGFPRSAPQPQRVKARTAEARRKSEPAPAPEGAIDVDGDDEQPPGFVPEAEPEPEQEAEPEGAPGFFVDPNDGFAPAYAVPPAVPPVDDDQFGLVPSQPQQPLKPLPPPKHNKNKQAAAAAAPPRRRRETPDPEDEDVIVMDDVDEPAHAGEYETPEL